MFLVRITSDLLVTKSFVGKSVGKSSDQESMKSAPIGFQSLVRSLSRTKEQHIHAVHESREPSAAFFIAIPDTLKVGASS